MAPLLNEETLMLRQFTPVTKHGTPDAISRNLKMSNPLRLNFLFAK